MFVLFFLVQKTTSEIQIDCLTRKLAEADLCSDLKGDACSSTHVNDSTICEDRKVGIKDSEAILVIKQLQEKVCIFIFSFILLFHLSSSCVVWGKAVSKYNYGIFLQFPKL